METLLDIARTLRLGLYRLTSSSFMGIEFDVLLHFASGAVIFWFAARRLGTRRAAWLLAGLIFVKEVADLFLKSQLRYITRPTPAVVIDIAVDIATGALGGLVAWWWLRRRRRALQAVPAP